MTPDSKLLNMIMSKCQPKQGQEAEAMAAVSIQNFILSHKSNWLTV